MPWPVIQLLDTEVEFASWFLAMAICLSLQIFIIGGISFLLIGKTTTANCDSSYNDESIGDVNRSVVLSTDRQFPTGSKTQESPGIAKNPPNLERRLTPGMRETYEWRKTGEKIQKTVKRQVAVEKITTHSRKVNDKWKKTGKMLQKEFEYSRKTWQSRNDTRLLYNKHLMKTTKKPIHPELTFQVTVENGDGNINHCLQFDTGESYESIESYKLTAETKQEKNFFLVEEKVRDVVEFAETVLDEDEIVWTDKEYTIEWQDTIVEVDDWELMLVEEEDDEQPQQIN